MGKRGGFRGRNVPFYPKPRPGPLNRLLASFRPRETSLQSRISRSCQQQVGIDLPRCRSTMTVFHDLGAAGLPLPDSPCGNEAP